MESAEACEREEKSAIITHSTASLIFILRCVWTLSSPTLCFTFIAKIRRDLLFYFMTFFLLFFFYYKFIFIYIYICTHIYIIINELLRFCSSGALARAAVSGARGVYGFF